MSGDQVPTVHAFTVYLALPEGVDVPPGAVLVPSAGDIAGAVRDLAGTLVSLGGNVTAEPAAPVPSADHAHVVLDGLTELERSMNDDGEPWQGYEGYGPADPKTHRDGYARLVAEAREWAEGLT